jgi:uncharacterized protein (TIGR00266 family)
MSKVLNHKIHGDDMQAVEITLESGEAVRSEAGSMLYMDIGVQMDTSMEGGVMKSIKRAFAGEKLFITSYTNMVDIQQRVSFAAPYPGKIITLELSKVGGNYYCQRDSYLCSDMNVDIEIAFTKRIGAGFFGGEGFILQELIGEGQAFIHAGGTIIEKDLKDGEKIKVDTGCLVAFSTTVDYDVEFVGGIRNTLFGGEGIFMTTLTGPGHVYLQSLPFSRMADRVVQSTGFGVSTGQKRGAAGFGGDFLKDVVSGN